MDYKFSNKSNFRNNEEETPSRTYNNNYQKDGGYTSHNYYNGKNKRFDNHDNQDKFDQNDQKSEKTDNYSRYNQSQGQRNYKDQNSYNNTSNNYNSFTSHSNNSYANNKSTNSSDSAWNFRYNRKVMNWTHFWDEDEKLLTEHLEQSKKKESFNIEYLEKTKLNVYSNGKEISTEYNFKAFSELGLNSKLKANLDRMLFDNMTPIQKYVIPYLMDKKDVMGCAQTGSGKTISFLAPIVNIMLKEGPPATDANLPYGVSAPVALILTPTRELCEQIYKEGRKLLHKTGILTVKVYGGVPIDTQMKFISNGCDILVATPGRLIDFIKRGMISLSAVKFLIFDEADRMLDMGFEDQLREIIFSSDMNSKDQRTNMMFSATFTQSIREIAKSFMNDYFFIGSNLDQDNNANNNIEQNLILVDEKDKVLKLHEILQSIKGSVIIFMDTKRGVDNLTYFLNQRNYNTISIHGDKTQDRRQNAINCFSNGEVPILIATDVAARGIDFPNVPYVFNFDLPSNIDDYIHRIGRTGRCGNKGTAFSFINDRCRIIRELYKLLIKSNQIIPEWYDSLSKRAESSNFSTGYGKKPYKNFSSGGYGNSYGGNNSNPSSNYQSHSNHSNNSGGGSNQSNPNRQSNFNRGNPNYVSVPADYFKKGENFKRESEAPRMNPESGNYNQSQNTQNNFSSSNSYQKPTFTRGNYQK